MVGHIGIGVDIDSSCDGEVVDRVVEEWRAMCGALNGMG